MILKGSQRAGGIQLANHLMNDIDNDHVTVHELRGFVAGDLHGAMKEAHAISRGTKRCRQFLFSLSLNPPMDEDVDIHAFENALTGIENRLGLTGQPRAIIFHEKESRRHCHAVWLRVDIERMRAINLPYFKSRLRDQSRNLFLEHGWRLPDGLMDAGARDPLNYSLAEWQTAKRVKADPKYLKAVFQDCWEQSDNARSFSIALERYNLILAKGDRRGHVAVDAAGNIYAISRWVGQKSKAVGVKLGKPDELPTAEEVKRRQSTLDNRTALEGLEKATAETDFGQRLASLRFRHRQERDTLRKRHDMARRNLARRHQLLLPKGVKALWFRATGQYAVMRGTFETEYASQDLQHKTEYEQLVRQQLRNRRELQSEKHRGFEPTSAVRKARSETRSRRR